MILVDVNLLLYAENADSPHHQKAKEWWESTLSSSTPIYFAWETVLGFLRMSTNRLMVQKPISGADSINRIESWFAQPGVAFLLPGPGHWRILSKLIREYSLTGNDIPDAHLAALALEHGLELFTADTGFSRFDTLRWQNPLGKAAN